MVAPQRRLVGLNHPSSRFLLVNSPLSMRPPQESSSAEIFAEWLREQGHQVYRTASSYWYDQGPRVYQAFPYHWVIQPTEEELARFLREKRAIALRYSTPLKAPKGTLSYHVVYVHSAYGEDNLGKWTRKNVRRGLRNCRVEPISFEFLAEEGWRLQEDTLNRQRRFLRVAQENWRRRCRTAAALPGFEAWGALVQGRLAASVLTFQMDNCCYLLYQQSHRDYLTAHVNNALAFVVTQAMIGRPGIDAIFYGLHSLDAPASVDEFKFRMGYQAKPLRQRVTFHPWLNPFINKAAHAVVKKLHHWYKGNVTLAKAEGMIRFYLTGN
jgi:hypothetical protein